MSDGDLVYEDFAKASKIICEIEYLYSRGRPFTANMLIEMDDKRKKSKDELQKISKRQRGKW